MKKSAIKSEIFRDCLMVRVFERNFFFAFACFFKCFYYVTDLKMPF